MQEEEASHVPEKRHTSTSNEPVKTKQLAIRQLHLGLKMRREPEKP